MLGAILSVALLGFALTSSAQLQNTRMDGGSTNAYTYVASAATNSPMTELVSKDCSAISLFTRFSCTASNGAAVTIRFDKGDGAGHWVTNGLAPWVITATGTTQLSAQTNLNVSGCPTIRIATIENPGSGGVTNLLINAWRKPGL